MWIDTHAHVTAADYDEDRDALIDSADAAGVKKVFQQTFGESESAAKDTP